MNVGTGKDISIKRLVRYISDIFNYKGTIEWDNSKPDGTPKKQLDVSRINKLGWHSKITLEDGLETHHKRVSKKCKNNEKLVSFI